MSNLIHTTNLDRIQNRESFLDNIAKKLGRERQITPVKKLNLKYNCHHEVMADLTQDELKDILINYTQTSLASQAIVTTQTYISQAIKEICEQYCPIKSGEKGEILLSGDSRLLSLVSPTSINSMHYDVNIWDATAGYETNIKLAERAKIGIVYAEQGLAESGTMVLYSNPNQGQAVSLLPEASIFVVAKSTLVARLTQATSTLAKKISHGEKAPSCINFISGPSSTADIELIKVVGVHGPTFAIYIIIDDM